MLTFVENEKFDNICFLIYKKEIGRMERRGGIHHATKENKKNLITFFSLEKTVKNMKEDEVLNRYLRLYDITGTQLFVGHIFS